MIQNNNLRAKKYNRDLTDVVFIIVSINDKIYISSYLKSGFFTRYSMKNFLSLCHPDNMDAHSTSLNIKQLVQ